MTLSSPPSSIINRSELGDSRSAVGRPLRSDRILLERWTPLPLGEINEFDRERTPTFFDKSASTEFELSFRRSVGGFEPLGPATWSSAGTRKSALRFDMLPASPRLYIFCSGFPCAPPRPDPAGFGRAEGFMFPDVKPVEVDEPGGRGTNVDGFFKRFLGLRVDSCARGLFPRSLLTSALTSASSLTSLDRCK